MIYRKDLFEASGIEIPTTLDEMVAAGEQLMADNADVPNFSGIYLPARNWHAAMTFVWANGGDIATQEGDQWVGTLDSPESIAGLEYFKNVFDSANSAPADADDANDWLAFCAGEVGMMPAPGWKPGQITRRMSGDGREHRRVRHAGQRGGDDRAGVPRRLQHRDPGEQRAARTWPTTSSRSWCRRPSRRSSPTPV